MLRGRGRGRDLASGVGEEVGGGGRPLWLGMWLEAADWRLEVGLLDWDEGGLGLLVRRKSG